MTSAGHPVNKHGVSNEEEEEELQVVLPEPFFQEIITELDEPINAQTLEKQQRRYRAMKNDLYVFYHEGKQNLLRQISEMTRLLEDRRKFRQQVVDNARKDPKRVDAERKEINMLLDEIDDVNQQIDLENEKQVVLDEEIEIQSRHIWETENTFGSQEVQETRLRRDGDILWKRLAKAKRQYNEKLGRIKLVREQILNLEREHKEFVQRERQMKNELQELREEIVPTLKAVKPILKKRTEFVTKAANTRTRAEKQKQIENEDMENTKRKMDHEAKLNKHIFEKKKPRQVEMTRPKDRCDTLWDPILYLNYE